MLKNRSELLYTVRIKTLYIYEILRNQKNCAVTELKDFLHKSTIFCTFKKSINIVEVWRFFCKYSKI